MKLLDGPASAAGLSQALGDAREQIKTLKDKLSEKQRDAIAKNYPAYVKMSQEFHVLKKTSDQVQQENDELKKRYDEISQQLQDALKALDDNDPPKE